MDIEIEEWDNADPGGRVPDSLQPVDGGDVAGGVSVAGEVRVRRSRWIHAAAAELVAVVALVVAPFLRVYSIRFGTGTMAIDGWGQISVSSSSLEISYSGPLDGVVLLLCAVACVAASAQLAYEARRRRGPSGRSVLLATLAFGLTFGTAATLGVDLISISRTNGGTSIGPMIYLVGVAVGASAVGLSRAIAPMLEGASGHMRGRVVTSAVTTDGPE